MSNYKIKVPEDVLAVAITDLFECLGAKKPTFDPEIATHLFLRDEIIYYTRDVDDYYFKKQMDTEITYDELNAMVYLKNEGKDKATHFMMTDIDQRFYVTSKNVVFFFNEASNSWVKSGVRLSEIEPMSNYKLINEYLDTVDLIGGLSAQQHVINGKDVEWARRTNPKAWEEYKKTTSFTIKDLIGSDYLFRLKEETFMIGEEEVPVSVANPELNKVYWFIDGYGSSKGYECAKWDNTEFKFPLACWDSENKIKRVVAALGKLLQPPLQHK